MSVQKDLMRQARVSGLALFFNIAGGAFTAVLIILQSYILAEIIVHTFIHGEDLQSAAGRLVQLGVIILLRAGLALLNEISAKSIATRVKGELRHQLLQKICRLGPVFLGSEKHGRLLNTIFEGVEALDAYYSQYLPQIFLSALIPLFILIAVFPREPLTGFVLLVTAPLIPIFMALIGLMTEQRTQKQWQLLNKLSTRFFDTLQSLELIRLLNRKKIEAEILKENDRAYREATMVVLRFTFLSAFTLELVATISTAIVAVEVGLRLLYGRLEFLPALFILILAPEFYLPLRQMGVKYHAAMTGMEAAGEIFALLQHTEGDLPAEPPVPVKATQFFPIRFHGVSAQYPGAAGLALKDVELSIRGGEQIAIVGPSGAGKTTLTALVMRFLTPVCGEITAAGRPLAEIPTDLWRAQIGWVPQNPHLFSNTIAWNVAFSEAEIDYNRLESALSDAECLEWVSSLPGGWNTKIGERGYGISTGQIQRLAIARAFYKNAPLLILDEPTSSLDPILEASLQAATQRLMQGRTVITIAHRLPTIYQSTRILFLKEGSIIEAGTHAELLKQDQEYAGFVRSYQHAA